MSFSPLLPVHGFVLAGGKSSRMGRDKALLPFRGEPMVAIALGKLCVFCRDVSISGNRNDLATFASVVNEAREGAGPVAGLEAGLLAARQPWAVFLPVDVPLVPVALLRAWVHAALDREGTRLSYLSVQGEEQPAFCLVHREAAAHVTAAIDAGERRIKGVLRQASAAMERGSLWEAAAEAALPAGAVKGINLRFAFSNLNHPEELASAERATESRSGLPGATEIWEDKALG